MASSKTKLTASAFNDRLKSVCQQSWSQGTLLSRTRRFFSSGGRKHRQHSTHPYTAWKIPGWYSRQRWSPILILTTAA